MATSRWLRTRNRNALRQWLRCEPLEDRCLPAGFGTITEYPVPTAGSAPLAMTPGPDGNLWFTEYTGNQVARINPSTGAVAEYPVPTPACLPGGIVAGPDGNIWFTEYGAARIGRLDPATGTITEFNVPTPNSYPADIKVGPDGALWFAE